jgi:hypothetical protein
MNRRNFIGLALGSFAAWLVPGCGNSSSSDPKADAADSAAPTPEQVAAVEAYQEENQKRIAAAIQRKEAQQMMGRAVAQTHEYRQHLQLDREADWLALLRKKEPIFLSLKQKAAHSPSGTVSCTICPGSGQMKLCVMCASTGVCPTCSGEEKIGDHLICPTCQGTGKCFVCAGSGQMHCPFCDDGQVHADQPFPPDEIPID